MNLFVRSDGGEPKPLQVNDMSYAQNMQARAIMDAVARLIPHEGVDYDVHITFKSADYNPGVSMSVIPLTDKGELWKEYVDAMIKKYPPVVDFHGDVIPYSQGVPDEGETETKPEKQEKK